MTVMVKDPTKEARVPFISACLLAILGLALTAVSLATPEWTVARGVRIGLWSLTDENGKTYEWTGPRDYEDFFYSSWFLAVRGMMMASIIIGSLGIFFNLFLIVKRKHSPTEANALMGYYLLAFALVVVSVSVYSCLIPQGLDIDGKITTIKASIVEYIYVGGYGYSLWIGWIASGFFLLACGLAFEGSNQVIRAKKMLGIE
ncbi:unnamed protein product [Clavelina lepadiformis]|uniref:Uncharacterized protein n=1 Tax=Clavelina lepadiformis TaxID=159417 RepID=A0ABP0GC11_CLALP